MSGKNYSKAVEDIKSRVSIVEVIGSVTPLKRAGSGYMCCCPFHKEKTPSFSVSESRNFYHCFGCGESGDAIKFVQKYYNLDFQGAVERLCQQYGIVIEETRGDDDRRRDEFYEANRLAARYFFDTLSKSANKGYEYMAKRGLSAKTMQWFGIGYTGEGWSGLTDHLLKNGVSRETLLALGLSSEKNGKLFDKFRSRVMFPIINVRGKVIGFGGRIIGDGEPKYLNSPESPVYLKKLNLYGINRSKDAILREGFAILVEGYMDCVSLYQSGVENVTASCGTALTPEQAKLLKRYTKKVVLCYDSDKAGINAALRGIDVLREAGIEVSVLNVDDGKDPDEYVKKHGKDGFLDLLKNKAMPDVDYKVSILRGNYDLKDQTQGIKFFKEIASIIRGLSPVEADIYIQKYAREYSISEGALRREVESTQPEKEKSGQIFARQDASESRQQDVVTAADVNLERMLIRLIMVKSSYLEKLSEYPEGFVTAKGRAIRDAMEFEYKPGREFEASSLANSLTDEESDYLYRIIDNIQIGDSDELAFADCIERLDDKRAAKRVRRIHDILEMADAMPEEVVDQEQINKLLTELQTLQNKNRGKN